jgi:hypothetical protein
VPAGIGKVTTWYRQYSPRDIDRLLAGWVTHVRYWGYEHGQYGPIPAGAVERFDYRDRYDDDAGAGAVAAIAAWPV